MISRFPIPTLLVTALILVAVSLPGSSLPDAPGIPGLDKIVHFTLFLMLAVAVQLDFNPAGTRRLLFTLVLALAFSALTEAIQLFVDGRSSELMDMLADMAGFLVGLVARRPLEAFTLRCCTAARRRLTRQEKP
jgi:VanZ family protein